jgi:uncharacterized coiled-coil DUF342 family protein
MHSTNSDETKKKIQELKATWFDLRKEWEPVAQKANEIAGRMRQIADLIVALQGEAAKDGGSSVDGTGEEAQGRADPSTPKQ